MRELPSRSLTVGLFAAFCCITVAAGHGIAPVGLVLVLGAPVTVPLGVGVVAFALRIWPRLTHPAKKAIHLGALALTFAVWCAAMVFTEIKQFTFLTSIVYLYLLGVHLFSPAASAEDDERPAAAVRSPRRGEVERSGHEP